MRDVIAQAEQEVVVAIVMRAKKFVGLSDQILIVIPHFLRGRERGGAVSGNIHLGERIVGQLHNLEKFAGDYRRIDQRGEGSGLKRDLRLAIVDAGRHDGQRRSIFPIRGKFQRGNIGEIIGLPSLGIEQDLIPTDDRHFVSGGRACGKAGLKGRGRKKIEFRIYFAHAGWDVDVDREAVEQIAAPRQCFSGGAEF